MKTTRRKKLKWVLHFTGTYWINNNKSRFKEEQEPEDAEDVLDSEEYEDEEDYDDRPRKKKKKDRFRDFIIEEAEVDSDVDEDEEYEEAQGEIGIVGNEVEESGQTAREIENRRRGTLWE